MSSQNQIRERAENWRLTCHLASQTETQRILPLTLLTVFFLPSKTWTDMRQYPSVQNAYSSFSQEYSTCKSSASWSHSLALFNVSCSRRQFGRYAGTPSTCVNMELIVSKLSGGLKENTLTNVIHLITQSLCGASSKSSARTTGVNSSSFKSCFAFPSLHFVLNWCKCSSVVRKEVVPQLLQKPEMPLQWLTTLIESCLGNQFK